MLWENLKVQDFPAAVEASKGVCVIPLGAMEKHGLHLGVGMDTIVVEEVARRAAALEPVVVFPSFHFGHINGLQHFDGSICLSNKLILDYMTELCREIARSGFRKILLLNGHGGNPLLFQTFCNSTAEQKKGYVVAFAESYNTQMPQLRDAIHAHRDAFPYLTEADIDTVDRYFDKPMDSGHACFEETIALLGVRPEAVDVGMMDKESGESTHRMDHLNAAGIYSPFNWLGNYSNSHQASYHPGANERLGRALMQIRVEDVAGIFKVFKEDEALLKYNDEWQQKW